MSQEKTMKKKTELLFESRVAANFMQSAGLSRETSNNLLEEMYGSSIDEYGDLYEVEEEEMETDVEGEEAPEGMGDEPMSEPVGDEPMDEPMGDDSGKEAKLEQIFKDLADLVGVEVEVEGGGEPMDEPMDEPMGDEELEEMDDAVLEETVRAILAK